MNARLERIEAALLAAGEDGRMSDIWPLRESA